MSGQTTLCEVCRRFIEWDGKAWRDLNGRSSFNNHKHIDWEDARKLLKEPVKF